ncbi:SGNH/GDSL hydrolase family protein [Leuconostoc mesenteroides]|uniref:SGNH/GDSL hydrolase family protein n=1 Tax=Leuconostoc mesenteroides TaxID=1245 RepID=UPI0021BEAA47|nr:SGNH/GDSL hydrolase family protein [Leuconostoc mesenteroides]MCT8386139.1 SGNH/GDSL hydrolase family protein [Leuconostoc mesenteroides]
MTSEQFYGALHVLLNGLQTKFPTVPKIFISAQHIGDKFPGFRSTVNDLGFTQDQYEEAIIKMTSKFGVPHLSLFSDMGVTFAVDAQADVYSVDSLHPNNAGHEIIADKVLKFLN